MPTLCSLSDMQLKVIHDIMESFPEDNIPLGRINCMLNDLCCAPISDKASLVHFLKMGGNAIYNFLLYNLMDTCGTDWVEELQVINFTSTLNRANKACCTMRYRYVWIWKQDFSTLMYGARYHTNVYDCRMDGLRNTPSYDSNDGVGNVNAFLSYESISIGKHAYTHLCEDSDSNICVDRNDTKTHSNVATPRCENIVSTNKKSVYDGFTEYHISDKLTLRQAPWLWYSKPPLYHYQLLENGVIIDNIATLISTIEDVYLVYVKPKIGFH